ncbi:hypothetical protein Sste5346_010091 [Sporothrix stenoceras]|uniref:Thump domain containing protein n=1 Tax=Sporothrix stenoceras TaxID=5173 RepID=A0ABR3YHH2_9PEZI
MSESTKRKSPPNAAPNSKRKKGGNNGKWSTPHQKVKTLQVERGTVEPGDVGIWVTCARSMEGRAAREMMELFDKYAKKMYGISIPGEDDDEAGDESGEGASNSNGEAKSGDADDIEDLVQKEIASLKAPPKNKNRHFREIRLNVECLLFSKMTPPIDPVAMAHRISIDVKRDAEAVAAVADEAIQSGSAVPLTRSFRYLNRLTPIAASGRATEKGVREVAHKVLSTWFKLAPEAAATLDGEKNGEANTAAVDAAWAKEEGRSEEKPPCTYTCGMSVVDGDWNDLRKYNLAELSNLQLKNKQPQNVAEVTEAIKATEVAEV